MLYRFMIELQQCNYILDVTQTTHTRHIDNPGQIHRGEGGLTWNPTKLMYRYHNHIYMLYFILYIKPTIHKAYDT